jgi:hypothetical protein
MRLISPSYTFNASAKTITCADFATYGLANILLINNVTKATTIYNPSSGTTKGTLASSTLTLTFDTTSHSNSDVLQIFVDNSATGATSSKQDTGNTSLASIDTKTPALSSGRVPVDGSGVTQPISGSVTVSGTVTASGPLTDTQLRATAVPVSASALPLPSGAATDRATAAAPASVRLSDGTAFIATLPVSAASLPLPTNAATSALQTTGNTSLSSIDTKTPALSSGRVPVDGSGVTQPVSIATMPSTPVTGTFWQATQPVSGPLTDTQLRASNVNTTLAAVTYPVSSNNSSSAQLAAGASFTGTIETIQNQQAAQISVVCDQAYTVQVQQFMDAGGTKALPVDTFIRAAGVPLNENVTLPGDYFRIVVTNNGGSTTTTLTIGVTFGLMATQPRALGQALSTGSWPVVIASDQTVPVNQAGVTATGSISILNSNLTTGTATTNSAVALSLSGATGFAVDVRGTFVGTITFQGSINGTDWFSINAIPAGGSVNVAAVSTATAVGQWVSVANGMQQVRATFSAFTSGSATITLRAMLASGLVQNFPTGQTTQVVSGTVSLSASTANIGYVGQQLPLLVADVASAALTTTTTTATLVPTFGTAYQVNIPVTVVSGTTPTLDVSIEESDDTGTNWFKIYDFPRITATGIYRSPALPNYGNRVRYVQTVTGTTPSFTRAVNRLQRSDSVDPIRQIIDRTVTLTTLSSTTPSITVQGARNVQLVVNVGAITTTAPALQLQGSDDNGATWYAIGSALTAVASSTVQVTVNNVQTQLVRAIVSTAGVGVTAGYVLVKAF